MKNVLKDSATTRLLVRVLATTDAIFWPIRAAEWKHPTASAIQKARQLYKQNGGVLISSPGTAAERKAIERAIDALIHNGFLLARQRGRGKYLRLPDGVEDCVRQLAALPGLWLSYETLRRYVRETWTPEIIINDGRGWGDGCSEQLALVELLMLPALLRGIAVSGSDVQGHVYYKRVRDVPDWPIPAADIEPVPDVARLYHEEALTARQRILATDVSSLEIGELPLPVSNEQ